MEQEKIRVGISSCPLGEKVCYDGGHKLDRLIRDLLGPYLQFVPVCPEVELGLPTVPKQVNALQHLLGYFNRELTADEKVEALELIEHNRRGHLPLIVPVTLLNHFVRKYRQPYLAEQYYLNPHPLELQLRNHG